jgi:hypothetical protein
MTNQQTDSLARSLGWFSLALGAMELLAPRALTRALGVRGREELVAAYGVREIATGIGILSAADPAPWIWGRVGGDALDLTTLAAWLGGRRRGNVLLALAAVAGVTALDVICARSLDAGRAGMRQVPRDYSDRSGLPRAPDAMRGAARDFVVPRDMRIPEALRPYPVG